MHERVNRCEFQWLRPFNFRCILRLCGLDQVLLLLYVVIADTYSFIHLFSSRKFRVYILSVRLFEKNCVVCIFCFQKKFCADQIK